MATDQALYGLDRLETVQPLPESKAARLARKAWVVTWPKVLAIALVLALWEVVALTGWKSLVFKGPGVVLPDLWQMMQHAQLWQAVYVTMQRAVVGYAISLLIGTVIGLLVVRIGPLRAAVGSIINGLQTMPSIAWYPFAIILFTPSTAAIMFVVVLGAAPSIAAGLITGVDYTPPLLLRAGRTMGLRRIALYRFLILPASLPAYVAGLKQGWAFAWRSLLAGELVVSIIGTPGLGVLLNTDQQNLDFNGATALVIVVLLLGIGVDMIFNKLDLTIRKRRGLLDPALMS
jgi:NitT/TauT family transport system permease protein